MFWFLGAAAVLLPLLGFLLAASRQRGFPLKAASNAPYWGAVAGLLALLSVAGDAYITHAVSAGPNSVPATASHYQMIHALALVALAILCGLQPEKDERFATAAGWLFFLGLIAFCGALFLRAAGLLSLVGLAPLGGTAFMLGWLAFAIALYRRLKP